MPQQAVTERREQISRLLAKSVSKPMDIANTLNYNVKDVRNDLYWMRKEARPWLTGYALDGYVFVTRNTIAQLEDIEVELQKMRQEAKAVGEKLAIMHELRETINMRWVIQGEGPTLMQAMSLENGSKATN